MTAVLSAHRKRIRSKFPKEQRAAQHPCAKRTVLRLRSALFRGVVFEFPFTAAFARRQRRRSRRVELALLCALPMRTSGSSEGLACFFFGTFFFQEKKKVVRSLFKKEISKSHIGAQRKNVLFIHKIFEYEKSYLFHIRKIL